MAEFLEKDFAMIEKHIRLIMEQDFFEKRFKVQFILISSSSFLLSSSIRGFFCYFLSCAIRILILFFLGAFATLKLRIKNLLYVIS